MRLAVEGLPASLAFDQSAGSSQVTLSMLSD